MIYFLSFLLTNVNGMSSFPSGRNNRKGSQLHAAFAPLCFCIDLPDKRDCTGVRTKGAKIFWSNGKTIATAIKKTHLGDKIEIGEKLSEAHLEKSMEKFEDAVQNLFGKKYVLKKKACNSFLKPKRVVYPAELLGWLFNAEPQVALEDFAKGSQFNDEVQKIRL